MAVGIGFDIHRLAPGKPLMLGGLPVPFDKGAVAHSDGDVVLHALCDALLGAAGVGDIGDLYPDTDPKWKDAPSSTLVEGVLQRLGKAWEVENVDATILAEKPRLGEFKGRIARRMADLLGISARLVNVKAKTMEGLGPIGTSDAVAAQVAVSLKRRRKQQADA